MDNQLARLSQANPLALTVNVLAALAAASRAIEVADAPNSRRAFDADLRDLRGWLVAAGVEWIEGEALSIPALAAYLGGLLDRDAAFATIKRRVASIAKFHRDAKLDSPTLAVEIRTLLKGANRTARPTKKKAAATPAMIRAALTSLSFDLLDRAILAVGFVTGLRRSELVALTWDDVAEDPYGGLILTIRRSKTDQTGEGQLVAVPANGDASACPATILRKLGREYGRTGLVFPVCDRTVDNLVKRAAELSGFEPSDFGAHSLRAGLATVAANAGVSLGEIMGATRHKSAQVASGYMRASEQGKNPAHHAAAKALV